MQPPARQTAVVGAMEASGRRKSLPPLPEEFADLQQVIEWALPTHNARYAKRMASTQEELEAAYAVLFPRAPAMIEYCERFSIADPPEEVQTLMQLLYSLIVISFSVEVWKQPLVPDSGATYLECIVEPRI